MRSKGIFHIGISISLRRWGNLVVFWLSSSHQNITFLAWKLPAGTLSFSVKKVSEFSYETHTYGIPSLALKIGYSMTKCAEDLHFIPLKNEDEDKKRISQTFVEMYNCDWKTSISAKALASLSSLKYNKTQLLLLASSCLNKNMNTVQSNIYFLTSTKAQIQNISNYRIFHNKTFRMP